MGYNRNLTRIIYRVGGGRYVVCGVVVYSAGLGDPEGVVETTAEYIGAGDEGYTMGSCDVWGPGV